MCVMSRTRPILSFILFIGFLFLTSFESYGQDSIKKNFPTKKLNRKTRENKSANRPKEKSISYIIKKSSKNTLYGNPCALEATRKMGFEFALEEKSSDTIRSFTRRWKHNLGVKMKLFFTRGPWWRLVVNKRIKECKKKSGDQVG